MHLFNIVRHYCCYSAKMLAISLVLSVIVPQLSLSGEVPDFARGEIALTPPESAPISFNVEVAGTPEERKYGLMYRTGLKPRTGMLFVYTTDAVRYFWMKNTPLSLDILFFSKDKILVHSVLGTTPFSEDVISSRLPARYVLELETGSAYQYGIGVGTELKFLSNR